MYNEQLKQLLFFMNSFIFSTISTELSDHFMMCQDLFFYCFGFCLCFVTQFICMFTLFQHFPFFISVSLFFHCCLFPDLTLSVVCVQVHLPTWCGKLIMSHLKCSASWLHNKKRRDYQTFFYFQPVEGRYNVLNAQLIN